MNIKQSKAPPQLLTSVIKAWRLKPKRPCFAFTLLKRFGHGIWPDPTTKENTFTVGIFQVFANLNTQLIV